MTKSATDIRRWEYRHGISRSKLEAALRASPPFGNVIARVEDTSVGLMVSVGTVLDGPTVYVTPEAVLAAHAQGGLADLLAAAVKPE